MKAPKMIYANGPFEVYKAGHVVIINENGELFCNLRKADSGFGNPAGFVDSIVAARAEAKTVWAAVSEERKERLETYLAARRGRVEAQPQFMF